MVFSKIHQLLGLSRCKIFLTAAAPITKDTLEFFSGLNMPIMELYGMSETSGTVCLQICPVCSDNENYFFITSPKYA